MEASPKCVGIYRFSMKTGSQLQAVCGLWHRKKVEEQGTEIIFYEPNCADDELLACGKLTIWTL